MQHVLHLFFQKNQVLNIYLSNYKQICIKKVYEHAYKQDYDIIGEYDIGIIENLTRHL